MKGRGGKKEGNIKKLKRCKNKKIEGEGKRKEWKMDKMTESDYEQMIRKQKEELKGKDRENTRRMKTKRK